MPSPASAPGGVPLGSLLLLVGGVLAVAAALLGRSGFTGRDHDALVGRAAKARRTRDPRHTIFNAKRFIGQSYASVVEGDLAAPYEFRVASRNGEANGDACFAVDVPGHPPCVTPVAVGGMIVEHLKHMAQRFVGHDQITKAVIAVPVDFNERQREATVAAFRSAGLLVSRVLEEPTAAAIAYGLHQDPAVQFVLVFDFGGGTLDVSLLFVRAGSIRVVDTLGDNHLGGEDVDAIVAEYLAGVFTSQLGVDKIPSGASQIQQAEEDDAHEGGGVSNSNPTALPPCTQAGVRRAAESLKRALSASVSATASCVSVDGLSASATLPKRQGSAIASVVMTREQFEELCQPLLERTMAPVRTVLTENHMEPEEVDAVVLVGGSSRIPWVRERLAELFGGRQPLTDIDPDVAVAYGAARTLD